MLEVKNLQVFYGAIHAIKGISLVVNDGELVSLVGANGAGKTTILHTISGLLKASSGEVLLDGKNLQKVPPNTIIGPLRRSIQPRTRIVRPASALRRSRAFARSTGPVARWRAD